MTSYFTWDPPRVAFTLPYFDLPIYWYSLFFAVGFYGAFLIARSLMRGYDSSHDKKRSYHYVDRLALYCFIGLLIGARLGHVLFYDLSYHITNPLDILNFRQGGLSSHGGIFGLFIALFLFKRKNKEYPSLAIVDILDLLAVSSAWMATCIRIGNFVNQEIVGLPTSVPWAVVFQSPLDATGGIPRHPTQLYEALVSAVLCAAMMLYGKKGRWAQNGRVAGWYLLILFIFRYLIEFFKVPQSGFDSPLFSMGQLLTIPVLIFALFLILRRVTHKQSHT